MACCRLLSLLSGGCCVFVRSDFARVGGGKCVRFHVDILLIMRTKGLIITSVDP
jgi:hypothetical protein